MISLLQHRLSVGLLIGLFGGLFAFSPPGLRWEENLGLAWLFNIRGSIEAPSDVVVINMDEDSSAALHQPKKIRDWQRQVHAQLIDRLVELGVSVIVFDVFFEEPREGDTLLAAAMQRAQRVALVQYLTTRQSGDYFVQTVHSPAAALAKEARGMAPFLLPEVPNRVGQFWSFLPTNVPTLPVVALQIHVIQAMGYRNFVDLLERAGVEESLPAMVSDSNDLNALMAILHNDIHAKESQSAQLTLAIDAHESLSTDLRRNLKSLIQAYSEAHSRYINYYGPPKTVPTLRYEDVLDVNNPGVPELSGKAVLIGSHDSSPYQQDAFYSVFSTSDGSDLGGVEIGATALANLMNDDTLRYPGSFSMLALLVFFGILIGSAAYLLSGIRVALVATLFIGLCYALVAQYAFEKLFILLPVFVPLLIQLPLALILGLMRKYLDTKRQKENAGRALRNHVPEFVAQHLTAGSSQLIPERVYGTCLISDVAGFTTLSEKLPPEELARRCNEYFSDLGNCVNRHNGEVLDIIGDGLTSVWSTSDQDPQKRLHACMAALELVQAVDKFNERHADYPFHTRIGLDSGWLAMGYMGGSGHYSYGITGDIANSASRIEGLNKYLGTTLLASENVVKGFERILLLRPVGCFLFKGKNKALNVAEIVCLQAKAKPDERILSKEFTMALGFFSEQKWSESLEGFNAISKRYPVDGPTEYYRKRCSQYLLTPPARSEGSVIRMEVK